jgi:hypothetical protein
MSVLGTKEVTFCSSHTLQIADTSIVKTTG